MKVTVKEKTENEIDFSVAGQYLKLINDNGFMLLVFTTGIHDFEEFEGIVLIDEENVYLKGAILKSWSKRKFKKFNGTITIEQ